MLEHIVNINNETEDLLKKFNLTANITNMNASNYNVSFIQKTNTTVIFMDINYTAGTTIP